MRRKDKEIVDPNELNDIIVKADICRLGLSLNNIPYVVPMNFGYKNNCLYFHSAKEGKKMHIIKENNKVCFEIESDHELIKGEIACRCGMKFRSVIGFGKAFIIEDVTEKKKALDIIMEHYDVAGKHHYSTAEINGVSIIKVLIDEVSGKKSGY